MEKAYSLAESQGKRLDSWKSIAQYVGRSCRTVQRWHIAYRLPVHRLGGDAGSVFAYTDELEDWLRNRDRAGETANDRPARPVLIQMPKAEPEARVSDGHHVLRAAFASDKARAADLVTEAYLLWGLLSCNNLRIVARKFRDALDLDPDNAEACSGLAHCLIAQGLIGNLNLRDAYSSALSVLERALQANPALSEAKCALAWLRMVSERDWQEARRLFDQALEHSSATTGAESGRALLHIAEGSLDKASDLLLAASSRQALNNLSAGLYCWCEYLRGAYSRAAYKINQARESGRVGHILVAVEALTSTQVESPASSIKHLEMLVEDHPANQVLLGALGFVFGAQGQDQKARAMLDRIALHASDGQDQVHYGSALVFIGLNEPEKAWQELDRSYRDGSLWSLGFPVDPILNRLREDPNYQVFMRRDRYPIAEDSDREKSRPA